MPTIGPTELIIVLVIVLIIFGVGRLPEIGGAIGKSIREFRDASKDGNGDKAKEQAKETAGQEPKA
jgi:sec-independent protein translocase protein TatA